MPPRDEQDYEQRRQQIIDGALEAFSEKGFNGASNRDIADAARIGSPGLIYHYFKDKVDLLHQVLIERMPVLRLLDDVERMLDVPPEVLLPDLSERVLNAYSQWPAAALIKVALAESLRNDRVARMVAEIGPGRGLSLLATYLERQMAAGRLRRMDPQIAARAFIGPLLAYSTANVVFRQGESISKRQMAQAAAEIFLRGMAPDQ